MTERNLILQIAIGILFLSNGVHASVISMFDGKIDSTFQQSDLSPLLDLQPDRPNSEIPASRRRDGLYHIGADAEETLPPRWTTGLDATYDDNVIPNDAVPEPTAALLVAVFSLTLISRRRR